MTINNQKKKFFKPKKPVDKMTEDELDEFVDFVLDKLISGITGEEAPDNRKAT